MNTLRKVIIALTLSSLGFAFNSSATPIIKWDWEVNSAFTTFEPHDDITGSIYNSWWNTELGVDPDDAPTKISWGTAPSNEPDKTKISSLSVSSGTLGKVVGTGLMNGVSAETAILTHTNNPIYSPSLISATLQTKLFLTPDGGSQITGIPPLVFNIVFEETLNSNDCDYSLALTELDLENLEQLHCEDDIFVIDKYGTNSGNGLVFNPFTNTFTQKLVIGPYTYIVEIMVDKLTTLANDVCARVAGAANPGCIGITTHEGKFNTFGVGMTIRVAPEPSTILLISLAIFFLIIDRRES